MIEKIIAELETIYLNSQLVIGERLGGMTNINYRIEINNKEYVLRFPGLGTNNFISRKHEYENMLLIKDLNIIPILFYYNIEKGIKITNYINHSITFSTLSFLEKENLLASIDICKKIHCSKIISKNVFDIPIEIQKYKIQIKKNTNKLPEEYYHIWSQIYKLSETLEKMNKGSKKIFCHNDLIPENFIKNDNGILYLLDWEYSGLNDPIADLASLFLETNITDEYVRIAIDSYFEGKQINDLIFEKIKIYKILIDFMWYLWTVLMESYGTYFGQYGISRYNRCIRNITELGIT